MRTSNIGEEEWATEFHGRHDWRRDRQSWIENQAQRIPALARYAVPLVLAALLMLGVGNDYVLRVASTACIYAILALGLGLVVGQAGLLDLGYVAYFGIGAYAYALLASPQLDLHAPTWVALPAAVSFTLLTGLVLGFAALRLQGDYLAIATLGFAQVVTLLALKLDRVRLPWTDVPLDLTGGPNGILGVDPPHVLGWTPVLQRDWFLLIAVALGAVLLVTHGAMQAPLGQAWRALRDDPLAAAAMGLPIQRLRVLAVGFGAALAGLAGALFAGWQGAIFPVNLDLALLLTLYAAIILGGMGSLPGAIVGAVALATLPELLRDPSLGRALVYGGGTIVLLWFRRPRGLALLGAGISGAAAGWTLRALVDPTLPGNLAMLALIAALPVFFVARRPWVRLVVQMLVMVLVAFVWETRLVSEPALARPLVLGLLLVALLIARPYGLFGRQLVTVQ